MLYVILLAAWCCAGLPGTASGDSVEEYRHAQWVHRDEFEARLGQIEARLERYGQLEERLASEVGHRQKLEAELAEMKTQLLDQTHLQKEVVALRTELGHWKRSHVRLRTVVRKQWTAIHELQGQDRIYTGWSRGEKHGKKYSKAASTDHSTSVILERNSLTQPELHKQSRQLSEIPTSDRVAFTVELVADLKQLGLAQTIKFDHIVSNLGNGFDLRSGIFNVRISGWYVLTLTAMIFGDSNMELEIVRDGSIVAKCWDRQTGGDQWEVDSVTQTVVLPLTAGNEVWVMTHRTLLLSHKIVGAHHTRFTGFLLYQD